MLTRMRRSRNAMRPASEQMALISAPERSSFWLMNSSRSTSSLSDIFDVWRVKIFFLVVSVQTLVFSKCEAVAKMTYDQDSQREFFDQYGQDESEQDRESQSC